MSSSRHVDDHAVDVDAEPVAEGPEVARRRPRRFVLGPRRELKLEQPRDVVLDPLLQTLFELELRQQERGPVRLDARNGDGALVEIRVGVAHPVDVGLRADDGDGGPVDDSHARILLDRPDRPRHPLTRDRHVALPPDPPDVARPTRDRPRFRYTTRTMAGSSLASRAAPAMARASVCAARTALPAG